MGKLQLHTITTMSSGSLLDAFRDAIAEQTLLTYDDAPDEELANVIFKVDFIQEEINRRMAW